MTKLIGALVILGAYVFAIYNTNIFVYQYDWTATLIPLVLALLYFTIILWWGKRKNDKKLDFTVEQSELRHTLLIEHAKEIAGLKDDYALEVKKNENYEKMWAQIKKQEDATINLGDTATTLKYHKPRKVTMIHLPINGTELQYKLGNTNKWYKRDELEKVEAIK